jgi:predicted permease
MQNTPDRSDGRIAEELGHHLSELRARLEREGLTPEEARAEALRRFGDPERVARATRTAGTPRFHWMGDGLLGDLVHVARGLRRSPTFTGSVVLTLGLALGATLAVCGVVWDVILRPLDLTRPEALVALVERMPETGMEGSPVSEGTFHDWRREMSTVSSVVAYEWTSETLEDPERPEQLLTLEVTGDFFEALGMRPLLGRSFSPADEVVDGAPPVVLLSHAFWTRRFGGDPGVIGRSLPVDGVMREVVGVLPRTLELFPHPPDIFLPSPHNAENPTNRGLRILHVIARLRPDATVAEASAEVAALADRIAEANPTSARGWSAEARPLRDHLLGEAERPLAAALAGVALLLLIGVVNVANLLHVRARDRVRELAVRAAVGAGRARLVRLGLVEAGVLCAAGGAAGLTLAWSLRRWLAAAEPGVLPRSVEGGLPVVVVALAVLLGALLTFGVGVSSAVRSAEAATSTLGRSAGVGARGRGGRRSGLLVAQLALTAVLLVGAGLLVRTVAALRSVDIGYDPEGVVAARVSLDPRRYPGEEDDRVYFESLLERVRALPGVRAAGVTSSLPMDPVAANFDLPTLSDATEGLGWEAAPQVDFRIVGPGVMEALAFRVVRGRTLDGAERPDGPLVALVNRSLAELFWPGQDAIGRRVQSVWRSGQWFEVVGVVEDTRFYGPRQSSRPELFVPLSQIAWGSMTVVARVDGDPAEAQAGLERAILETDPLLPARDVFEVSELVDATHAPERFYALLLSGFALLALSLAAVGVYGMFAYDVRQRTQEMGVRLAFGAPRTAVVGRILGRSLGIAGAGIVAGLAGALPASRLLSEMLFGVEAADPLTLATVALLLFMVAAGACLRPALRAARLDPATVLRED